MQQVTVITGGSRGIGAATAQRLAVDGHHVAIGYLQDSDAAAKVVDRVVRSGSQAVAIKVDTSVESDVAALFEVAAKELGPITGLVNNAGITSRIGRLADSDTADLRRVIDVNVLGFLFCARQAARVLGRGGSIVNISSGAATLGSPGEYVHYAASKAAVDGLTIGLAKELAAEGIRVNAVAPGIVRTEIHAVSGDPTRPDTAVGRIPMGRAGEPGEIAAAVAWLLSPAASYTTGAIIRVSGGL